MRDKIINSWEKIQPDQATQDSLLNEILVSTREARPNKAKNGLRFSLRTLAAAVAIVALSATSAFAAYSAGVNAAQTDEVGQLNEIIAALEKQNADLSEQVEAVLEEVEELRRQLKFTQAETPVLRKLRFEEIDLSEQYVMMNFSSLAEAAEYASAPFKESQGGSGISNVTSNFAVSRFTNLNDPDVVVPGIITYHRLANNRTFMFIQMYFGPGASVDIETELDFEEVMIGGIEAIRVKSGSGSGLYWVEDNMFCYLFGLPADIDLFAVDFIQSLVPAVQAE
ncbi:MAG: hypothetical protein FWD39_05190 [Clostridiales bacterium]|nr:hypothetical protein [Clostridiales bacterium]